MVMTPASLIVYIPKVHGQRSNNPNLNVNPASPVFVASLDLSGQSTNNQP